MTTTTFNSGSGTFVVPAGMVLSKIELWGPGGDGGDGSGSGGGAGGGGGSYCMKNQAAAAGTSIAYSVGAVGNNTTCTTYSLVAGFGTNGISSAIGIGGSASGGDINTSGQNGLNRNGKNGGDGGFGGNGGAGGAGGPDNGTGGNGTAPGGAGGGAGHGGTIGNGSSGRVTFTYLSAGITGSLLLMGVGT